MTDSVKPLKARRKRSGSVHFLCPPRAPFILNAGECRALVKLIRCQRDAFWEAESGVPRSGDPFTMEDMALLEPLLQWLDAKPRAAGRGKSLPASRAFVPGASPVGSPQ